MEESSAESGRRFTAAGTIDKPILRGYGKLISRRMQGRRIVFTVPNLSVRLSRLVLLPVQHEF